MDRRILSVPKYEKLMLQFFYVSTLDKVREIDSFKDVVRIHL